MMHEANIIQAAGDTHLDLDLDLDLLLRLRDLDFDLEVFFPLRLRDLCVKQCAQCVMYNNICKTPKDKQYLRKVLIKMAQFYANSF